LGVRWRFGKTHYKSWKDFTKREKVCFTIFMVMILIVVIVGITHENLTIREEELIEQLNNIEGSSLPVDEIVEIYTPEGNIKDDIYFE
jgi:anaerobic C4-dicarboxylate transporter